MTASRLVGPADAKNQGRIDDPRRHVIIVGSGFGGLGMAIKLRAQGFDSFTVLERGADVGGTWRDNTYPGAACDIQSHLYSFSFEPNPRWSRMYAEQAEILAYLRHCAEKYGVRAHIRFDAQVTAASWHEARGLWEVRTKDGAVLFARAIVSATGGLSRPALPDIPGLATFGGKTFHSAEWDHDYDLAGKRVAVLGTGASAIQIVPEVAKVAKHLTVLQRTPPWIIPKADRAIGPLEQSLYTRFPNMIDDNTPVTFTLTQRQAILLYFKSEWILASGTVEENNRLARDILAQIKPQLFNQPQMQKHVAYCERF